RLLRRLPEDRQLHVAARSGGARRADIALARPRANAGARDMTMPAIEQAAILCGGLGTRLGALTAATPKPLLPVGERPFLDILLGELGQAGVTRILLLAGFMAKRMADYAAATRVTRRFGLAVDVAAEPYPAGTGGALWHARDRLD